MRKIVLFSIALFLASGIEAGTIDTLKSTPVNSYELGVFKLQFVAYKMEAVLKGERVTDTDFRYYRVSAVDTDGKLELRISLAGRARYMSDEQCQIINKAQVEMWQPITIARQIWPNL